MTALGVKITNTGPQARDRPGMTEMARVAEAAGVDTAHLSDHIVLVDGARSRYPFTADGAFPWPADLDVYDPMAACAWIIAQTERLAVGPSVLVLPQRHPLEVAKTAATIDRLSGGRLFLGVGAGWLAEEFEALGQDFNTRGSRLDEAIDVLRHAWSADMQAYQGKHFSYGPGVHCRPLPERPEGIPIFVGGMSAAALRRAARLGDGWIALTSLGQPTTPTAAALRRLEDLLGRERRDRVAFRAVLRVVGTTKQTLAALPHEVEQYARLGFDEIAVDPLWEDLDVSAKVLADCWTVLRTANDSKRYVQ